MRIDVWEPTKSLVTFEPSTFQDISVKTHTTICRPPPHSFRPQSNTMKYGQQEEKSGQELKVERQCM